MKKFISHLRMWIYIVGGIAIVVSTLIAKQKCSHKDDRSPRTEITVPAPWPADLIPHPHLPEPKPGGDMA